MKRPVIGLVLLVIGGFTSVAQASDALSSWSGRPLVIAIPDESYEPFHSWGADGNPTGFDVDVADAICAKLQAKCSKVRVSFDQSLQGLMKRKAYDAVIGAIDITPERKKVVDFSQAYIRMPAALAVRKADQLQVTAQGLKGKRIGVGRMCPKWPSTGGDYIRKSFGKDVLVTYYDGAPACPKRGYFLTGEFKDTLAPRLDDLAAGKIDAVLEDKLSLYYVIGQRSDNALGLAPADLFDYRSGQGIAVRKHRADLVGALNAALTAMLADGTYRAIELRYFPFPMLPK